MQFRSLAHNKPGGVIATNTNTSDNGEFIIPSMFQRMK